MILHDPTGSLTPHKIPGRGTQKIQKRGRSEAKTLSVLQPHARNGKIRYIGYIRDPKLRLTHSRARKIGRKVNDLGMGVSEIAAR